MYFLCSVTMREELRRATEELLALRNRTQDLEQKSTNKEQEIEDLDRLRATNHSQLLLIQNLQVDFFSFLLTTFRLLKIKCLKYTVQNTNIHTILTQYAIP